MSANLFPSGTTSRPLIGALLLVAVVLGIVGCTDAAETPPPRSASLIDQIKDATFAEGSAAYSGQTRFADGTSGAVDGASRAEPPAGEVTHPVHTATGPRDVTFLWVDGSIFIQRAVTADSAAVSATLRLDSDAPWTRAAYQPLATTLFDAYDPFRLLERLSLLKLVAEQQSTEVVDERELERYVVDMEGVATSPGRARTIELLTDTDHRLQVVRLVGDDTIEYALTGFGGDVAPTPPPDDQIGGSTPRPSVVPVGPFETVATGTAGGGGWQLLRAPGSDGGSCWRMDAQVPLDPVAATQADGVSCIGAFDPTASADEQVQVVVDAGTGAPFDAVVAAVAPGSTEAEVQLADGTTHPLAIDPGGFVVWTGPKTPLAVVLELTAPDGNVVTCGPGPVSSLDDLDLLPADDLATLDRAPWLCLEL